MFGAKYLSESIPAQKTIIKCINKFERTGSVENIKQSGRPKSSTDNDKAIDVLAKIFASPIKSGLKLASEVYRILRRFKFHPYKIRKIQKLFPSNPRQRIDFCQWGMEKVNQDDHFVENFFSDETIYYLITNAILE
jgi:hypothetical protein